MAFARGSALPLLVLAALACSSSPPRVASPVPPSGLAERIRRVEGGLLPLNVIAGQPLPAMTLADRMTHFRVPGVSIAVVNDGRIEWAKGYGVAKAGADRPVDANTLFQAASISKPVAALAALRLVEQGHLALDDDVNGRLTSWRVPASPRARGAHVTLRRILTHTAGLTVHGFAGYAAGEPVPTTVQVLEGAAPANSSPVRIDTTPGSVHRYSGGGFTVAQVLMSDVTGRPFAELMDELVLRPLGMVNSTYRQPLPAAFRDRAATAHGRDGTPIPGEWHTYPEQAAAGLWTTPSDLASLILGVQRMAAGEQGGVLTPAMTHQMLTHQAGAYGLGFGVGGEGVARIFAHGGSNAGFRAMFVGFVETGRGAVVMTNGDLGGELVQEILRGIAHVYGWEQFKTTEKTVVSIDSATLASFVGRYRLESSGIEGMLAVTLDGGRLRAQFPNWLAARTLHAAAPDRFFMLESAAELHFLRSASGVTAVALVAGADSTRAVRVP